MTTRSRYQIKLFPSISLFILPWLLIACQTSRQHTSAVGPATVAMPDPANEAEARFVGDIGSALRSRGWDPQPASKAANAGHRITFAIRPSGSGFNSRIELRSIAGQTVASGSGETDRLPGAIGDVALVFDESLAAFQRSIARVPPPK